MKISKEQGPNYFVTSAPHGDYISWRVVREETGSRGMKTISFICGYPTQRAAIAIAKALSSYRGGNYVETKEIVNGSPLVTKSRKDNSSFLTTNLSPPY